MDYKQIDYKQKYLKYKIKYYNIKQKGGFFSHMANRLLRSQEDVDFSNMVCADNWTGTITEKQWQTLDLFCGKNNFTKKILDNGDVIYEKDLESKLNSAIDSAIGRIVGS